MRSPDMRGIASADADFAFLAAAKPNVLMLDVGLRDEDSLARGGGADDGDHPDAKIIVMDLFPVHEEIREFVNAGVAGFVLKDASFDEFVETIRAGRRREEGAASADGRVAVLADREVRAQAGATRARWTTCA